MMRSLWTSFRSRGRVGEWHTMPSHGSPSAGPSTAHIGGRNRPSNLDSNLELDPIIFH